MSINLQALLVHSLKSWISPTLNLNELIYLVKTSSLLEIGYSYAPLRSWSMEVKKTIQMIKKMMKGAVSLRHWEISNTSMPKSLKTLRRMRNLIIVTHKTAKANNMLLSSA